MRIPKGWAPTSLEAVCHVRDSRRIPVNKDERSQRIAGKSIGDLYPYYGATGQVGLIDDFIFDGEHVLLGEDGAPFLDPFKDKAYLVSGKFWVNNHAHILCSVISNKFVLHYLNHIDYSEHVTGTTRLKLTQGGLRRIPIRVAPTDEQNRIVAKIEELFSKLDRGVENLKKAREQLKVYRQAVVKHAFEGKLTARWRADNKDKLENSEQLLARIKQEQQARHEGLLKVWRAVVHEWERRGKQGRKPRKPRGLNQATRYVADRLDEHNELPFGWTWTKLGSVFDVVSGGTPKGLREATSGDIPYYKVSDMNTIGNEIRMDVAAIYLSERRKNELGLTAYPEGTVIFPKRGGAILTNKKRILSRPSCFDLNTMGVVNATSSISNEYFWHWFQSLDLAKIYDGSNVPQINNKNVEPLPFPICSIEEQRQIASVLKNTLSLATQMEADINRQLKKAAALRQMILKKAFSGQLVAQDPKDEPASILLKRIKTQKVAQSQSDKLRKERRRAKAKA